MTWACGLLAKTERLTVFGTVHAPLFPPLIAAKQFVTADHIGEGRFGLNLVCGWNEGELEMFGAESGSRSSSSPGRRARISTSRVTFSGSRVCAPSPNPMVARAR